MNRRNVLVLLAVVAIGGGLIAGTGAFSQVEASRTADVGVSGDSSALLKIEDNTSSSFVSTTTTDGDNVDTIEFQENDLNDDATTRYNYSLSVTNNGESPVNFHVDTSGVIDMVNANDDNSVVGDGNSVSLANGDTVELHIVITTTDGSNTFPDEITFVAESA
jgi:uncharacterized cupredoxin-like copper-binding protein